MPSSLHRIHVPVLILLSCWFTLSLGFTEYDALAPRTTTTIMTPTTTRLLSPFEVDPTQNRWLLENSSSDKTCRPLEQCEMCTFSDQKSIDACKETGRKQKMECSGSTDDKGTVEYFSCKYTDADQQFEMIRFQMICLVLGFMALFNVRKQKRSNASLFDQRKQSAQAAKRATRTSEIEQEIEFSKIEESIPLMETSNNPLAVV